MSTESAAAEDLYLRAGIGLDRPAETEFRDANCEIEAPVPLYGCGRGPDGAPYRSVGHFGTVTGFEAGLGSASSRRPSGSKLSSNTAHASRSRGAPTSSRRSEGNRCPSTSRSCPQWVADLRGPAGAGLARGWARSSLSWEPGLGAARIETDETRMMFPATTTLVPGTRRTGFAWMVTAGIATALSKRTTLDIAWRYTDLGAAETDTGGGRVVWRDGEQGSRACSIRPRARRRCGATGFASRCATRSSIASASGDGGQCRRPSPP